MRRRLTGYCSSRTVISHVSLSSRLLREACHASRSSTEMWSARARASVVSRTSEKFRVPVATAAALPASSTRSATSYQWTLTADAACVSARRAVCSLRLATAPSVVGEHMFDGISLTLAAWVEVVRPLIPWAEGTPLPPTRGRRSGRPLGGRRFRAPPGAVRAVSSPGLHSRE